jgi:hypothetical protein|tara:strand:+ start:624 stop:986 length:363 start_codon:yes stop_codon:yes gene_type:complete
MPASTIDRITALGGKLTTDLSIGNTSQNNVTGAAGTLYMVTVDNTVNTGIVYLKMADALSGGANVEPNWQFKIPASTKLSFVMPEGSVFSTGLSIWCVQGAVTSDNTPPANSVVLNVITS